MGWNGSPENLIDATPRPTPNATQRSAVCAYHWGCKASSNLAGIGEIGRSGRPSGHTRQSILLSIHSRAKIGPLVVASARWTRKTTASPALTNASHRPTVTCAGQSQQSGEYRFLPQGLGRHERACPRHEHSGCDAARAQEESQLGIVKICKIMHLGTCPERYLDMRQP